MDAFMKYWKGLQGTPYSAQGANCIHFQNDIFQLQHVLSSTTGLIS